MNTLKMTKIISYVIPVYRRKKYQHPALLVHSGKEQNHFFVDYNKAFLMSYVQNIYSWFQVNSIFRLICQNQKPELQVSRNLNSPWSYIVFIYELLFWSLKYKSTRKICEILLQFALHPSAAQLNTQRRWHFCLENPKSSFS